MTSEVDEKTLRVAAEHVRFSGRLMEFAKESNRIEGITNSEANERMFEKLESFLTLEELTLDNVCDFNDWGILREMEGMNGRVGERILCPGGIKLVYMFQELVEDFCVLDPFESHKKFECLHPFTDGNGRTGRAIWLWQMVRQHDYDLSRGFLWEFYYQSLRN